MSDPDDPTLKTQPVPDEFMDRCCERCSEPTICWPIRNRWFCLGCVELVQAQIVKNTERIKAILAIMMTLG